MNRQALAWFVWSVGYLLRCNVKRSELGRIILPFTLLRHLDPGLVPTRYRVLVRHNAINENRVETRPHLA